MSLVSEWRKPFDLLAEWLLTKDNRDDKTPIELFLAGIRALALHSHITDVVRSHLRFSQGTGGN